MYKYNCRKCPIRNRCITWSNNSPSVKQMIQAAFEARTDTTKVWNRLQRDCLLVKAEEERERRISTCSLLSRRLREARENKEKSDHVSKQKPDYLQPVSPRARSSSKPGSSRLKRLSSTPPKLKPLSTSTNSDLKPSLSSNQPEPEPLSPSPETEPKLSTPAELPEPEATPSWVATSSISEEERPETIGNGTPSSPPPSPQTFERKHKSEPGRPHWLTTGNTGRHIALPVDGELVLGRFDPQIGIPPDVDLTYEDHQTNTVSRRHAKIVGLSGYHTIEDLGSREGVSVNGRRIQSGLRRELKPGDRITLGQTPLVYDVVPTQMLMISPTDDRIHHIITVTPTGRQLTLAPPDEAIIGRVDTYVDFVPDIDLSEEGEVATRVSRRHASITWRNRVPYVEDLGSGFGTRLNGEMLLMGQVVQLKPGDHIWLGGCVLAYDVEL